MSVLTAVLTHLDAPLVAKQLGYLRRLAPASRFVVCHGGGRSAFERLSEPDALWIDDPSLRGPHFEKSLNDTLGALYERWVRHDATVDSVYLVEYDHLILRGDFEARLVDVAERTGAGLLAKWAGTREDSNWPHHLATRGDRELDAFIRRISRRQDGERRLGCLGTGLLLRRDALAAFCALEHPPSRYVELFVPTVVHHLGFDVVDMDAVSDLYQAVRWQPPFGLEEAVAAKHAGRAFVHPFKDIQALDAIREV